MIPVRIEKLKFIVEEMQIAFHLATQLTDPFLTRTIARRAERRVWALARVEAVRPEVTQYLNRLSDLLFVLARVLARHELGTEVPWHHERGKGT